MTWEVFRIHAREELVPYEMIYRESSGGGLSAALPIWFCVDQKYVHAFQISSNVHALLVIQMSIFGRLHQYPMNPIDQLIEGGGVRMM
jgi:hypothetical protein